MNGRERLDKMPHIDGDMTEYNKKNVNAHKGDDKDDVNAHKDGTLEAFL